MVKTGAAQKPLTQLQVDFMRYLLAQGPYGATVRELQIHFNMSRSAINRALNVLIKRLAGLIVVLRDNKALGRGSGYFYVHEDVATLEQKEDRIDESSGVLELGQADMRAIRLAERELT